MPTPSTISLPAALSALVPTPDIVIDFTTNAATVQGVATPITDIFASDPDYGVTFDAGEIVAGEGYVCTTASNHGGKLIGTAQTFMRAQTSSLVMLEFVLTQTGNLIFDFYEATYASEFTANLGTEVSTIEQASMSEFRRIFLGPCNGGDNYSTQKYVVNRAAVLYTPEIIAMAINGQGIGSVARGAESVPADTWVAELDQNDRLRKISCWGGISDIVTMQNVALFGDV